MPRMRTVEQALRIASTRPSRQYVCRACRLHATRRIHTSRVLQAETDKPWTQRLRESLFGSKESEQAAQSRDEKRKKRVAELEEHKGRGIRPQEIKTDKHGREYEVAAYVDPSVNEDYVQASSWDGLESVGSEQWVKQRADHGEPYIGFVPKKRIELSDEKWELLLHHIAVEVLALQKAGRDIAQVCLPRTGDPDNFLRTRNSMITNSRPGLKITFEPPQAEQELLQAIPETQTPEQQANEDLLSQEVQGAVAEGELLQYQTSKRQGKLCPTWMDVPVKDPTIKLTILKRVLQLTGKRLPDPIISHSASFADLYNAYKEKEKPTKLAQAPQLQKLKVDVPNVKVHGRRQTPIDKEREIGRWKVIEEELIRRDLPVTGSRWVGAKSYIP